MSKKIYDHLKVFIYIHILRKAAPWYRRASLLGFQEDLRRLRSGDILVHFGSIFDLLGEFWALLELSWPVLEASWAILEAS